MKKFIGMQIVLMLSFLSLAKAASAAEVDPNAALHAPLGVVQVQYMTEKCGARNISIIAELEYIGPEKTARIESFIPKINSQLFLYISDYTATRSDKKIKNRDILKIIKGTTEKILGKDYISEVLIFSILRG